MYRRVITYRILATTNSINGQNSLIRTTSITQVRSSHYRKIATDKRGKNINAWPIANDQIYSQTTYPAEVPKILMVLISYYVRTENHNLPNGSKIRECVCVIYL